MCIRDSLNPFSDGELIKSETTGTWQTHNGVDLSCAAGADVFAIDTGTVSKVCSDALWGYTVTIDLSLIHIWKTKSSMIILMRKLRMTYFV